MFKYNEKELFDGVILFSSEKQSKENDPHEHWGLSASDGTVLVEPKYSYKGKGIFNGEKVVLFTKYNEKKIYLVEDKKMLFDNCTILGKEWSNVPELSTKKYGPLFYVMNKNSFCLVTKNEEIVYSTDTPLSAKTKVFDYEGDVYLINDGAVSNIEGGGLYSKSNRIIDNFFIGDKLFLIGINENNLTNFIIQHDTGDVIVESFSFSEGHFAHTSYAFFVLNSKTNTVDIYSDKKLIKTVPVKDSLYLIEIDDRVLIGIGGITIDVYTGEKVLDVAAFKRIENTELLIIRRIGLKGVYDGIADYRRKTVLIPSFFDTIISATRSRLILRRDAFSFDTMKKTVVQKDRPNLIRSVFEKVDWSVR